MKIKRTELYRRVWETPIRTLAREFDISDVGLAKACRNHAIPLPPVGHWTKVQHGKPVSGGTADSEPASNSVRAFAILSCLSGGRVVNKLFEREVHTGYVTFEQLGGREVILEPSGRSVLGLVLRVIPWVGKV